MSLPDLTGSKLLGSNKHAVPMDRMNDNSYHRLRLKFKFIVQLTCIVRQPKAFSQLLSDGLRHRNHCTHGQSTEATDQWMILSKY